jgi:glucose/arabinose dehydrogenase
VGDSGNQLTNQVELDNDTNILWGTDGNDSLIGTAEVNILIGRAGRDSLAGGPGKNSFLFQSLKDSLLSGAGPDHIRNLKIGTDIIGGPNPVPARKVLKAGRVSKLTTREIRRVLTNKNFAPNRAAVFTVGKRTFVALNNNKAGFQANGVALIDITGYSGSLTDLAIAGPRSYADPNEQYSMGGENNLVVSESDLFAQVLVRRTGNALTRETLEYVVTENSASIGEDFISPTLDGRENTGQAVFEVGERTAYISIPIVNDNLVESTEAFSVGLQKASNGTLSFPRTVNVDIIDDDGKPRIGFLSASIQTTEGSSSVEIKVIRSGNNTDTVSVDFATSNGTAVAGLDYQPASGTLTFNPGEIEKIITVDIIDNNVPEPTEAFTLSLLNAPPSVDLINSQTQVTILDDDQVGLSDFVRQEFVSSPRTTDFDFSPDGKYLFTASKEGVVRVFENGVSRAQAVVDISAQVNSRGDRGITGIAVHPDFYNQPYIYLAHTYDPPETQFLTGNAGRDGSGNRPARVVRLEVNLETLVANRNSLKVILGSNSGIEFFDPSLNSLGDITIPATGVSDENSLLPGVKYDKGFQDNDPGTEGIQNYNLRDYIATDSGSHTIGAIRFGPDGHLYVATGDGTSFNFPDPRTVRVQDPSNLSGKILRIDPMTGAGIESNPFYDGDPDSNPSKVFYYGLRNPFRFTFDPITKLPVIADVGWSTAEEVNTGPPGSNFGWPYLEGNVRTPRYRDLEEALRFYANGNINEGSPDPNPAVAPLISPRRGVLAGAIIVSDFFDKNTFLFGDIISGKFFAATLKEDRSVGDITPFESVPTTTVSIRKGPDNLFYAASLNRSGPLGGDGLIYRWVPNTDTIDV